MTTAKCLKVLKKRGRDLSFDKQELAALKIAISLIEEYESWDEEEEDLGTQTFGRNWREDLALTQEEKEMLSR